MAGFRDGPVSEERDSSGGDSSSGAEHMGGESSQERSVQDIVENVRMTDKHKSFLRCVFDYGGEASISKIKNKTGLNQDEAHSRFRKWSSEEFNLIDVEKLSAEESGRPTGERVAVLNERGEQAIQKGLIGDVFDESEQEVRKVFGDAEVEDFEELGEEVNRLGNVVDRLQSELDAESEVSDEVEGMVGELEDDIIRLSDKVGGLESRVERAESEQGLDELDGLKARVSALEGEVDEHDSRLDELGESFDEFREKVRGEVLNAQAYMKGIRWALEEDLSESLQLDKYISKLRKDMGSDEEE
jgi:phage shock protein A